MSQTFFEGYSVAIALDADTVIGLTAHTYDLSYGPATLQKRTFGVEYRKGIAGQASGTVSLAGHDTAEAHPKLMALLDPDNQPTAIVVTHPDGASESYSAVVRVGISASADGEVDWTLDGDLVTGVTVQAAV